MPTRPRNINVLDDVYFQKPPPVPLELKGIKDAQLMWKFLARRFTKTRVLKPSHLNFMSHLCATWAEMLAVRGSIADQIVVEETRKADGQHFKKTYKIPHPDREIYMLLKQEFRASCSQFGMTPLTVNSGVEPDDFDPF